MFNGFNEPLENWSKLPHQFIEALPIMDTLGELKVVLYILRHTWGYHDSEKRITLDEFENGRKRSDGSRIDGGTGMSRPSIINGLQNAEKHGFIQINIDDRDKARVKKVYSLHMDGGKVSLPLDVKELYPGGQETLQRSEKDTEETNSGNKLPGVSPVFKSELDRFFGQAERETQEPGERVDLRNENDRDAYLAQLLQGRAARVTGEPWLTAYTWITHPRSGIERDTLRHVAWVLVQAGIPAPESDTSHTAWKAALVAVYQESGGDWAVIEQAGREIASSMDYWPCHRWHEKIAAIKAKNAGGPQAVKGQSRLMNHAQVAAYAQR